MKKILLSINLSILCLSTFGFTVNRDSVEMGQDYKDDIYYSFSAGVNPTVVDNRNYHLAFSNMISQNDKFYTLWLNPETAKAYVNPNQPVSDWNQFSTANSATWDQLHNADTSWGKGAFSQGKEIHPRYTWAKYVSNGRFKGDSMYLLKIFNTSTSSFDITYKLMLEERVSIGGKRSWIFKLGKTDNTWDTTITINDLVNSQGNFMYFNVLTNKEKVREPNKTKWDYVFTRYNTFTQDQNYTVTGLLANYNIASATIDGNINDQSIDDKLSFWQYDSLINNIGFDWKVFNRTTFKFELEENKVHLIKKNLGNGLAEFYALQFVRFDGVATGKIVFDWAYLGQFSSTHGAAVQKLSVYPNPGNGNIHIADNSKIKSLNIYNLNGKIVSSIINPQAQLNLSYLQTGNYLLLAEMKNGNLAQFNFTKL